MLLGKWLRPRFPWETVKRKRKILEDFVIKNLLDNICFILYYNSRIPPNGKDAENVCF